MFFSDIGKIKEFFVRYRKDKGKGNVNVHGKVIYRFVGIDKRYVSRSIASFPQFV